MVGGPLMGKFGKYWVAYYLVFLVSVIFLTWRHWDALRWNDESYVFLLAAIFGMSAGLAAIVAVFVEVIGTVVLLIPARVKKLRDEGRREAHRQWRAWNARRMAAEREGQPFDEPPPGDSESDNGK